MRLLTLSGINELQTVSFAEDVFYFWFPYGLGDLYIVTLLKDKIDEVLGGKSIFIVQDKHSIIPDLYGIDYISIQGNCRGIMRPQCAFSEKPVKGRVSGGHPSCCNPSFGNYLKDMDGVNWYKKYFGISTDYTIDKSKYIKNFQCRAETRMKIKKACGAEVEDIAFFIPDALSTNFKCVTSMNQIIADQYSAGSVVYNSIKNAQLTQPAVSVDLTLSEVLEICFNCKAVVSNRNGICDVIHTIGSKMTVLYDKDTYHSWAVSKMFGNDEIHEIIL